MPVTATYADDSTPTGAVTATLAPAGDMGLAPPDVAPWAMSIAAVTGVDPQWLTSPDAADFLQSLAHQGGRLGRIALEGLAAVPASAMSAGIGAGNLLRRAARAVGLPVDEPSVSPSMPFQAMPAALDALVGTGGQDVTPMEQATGAAGRGMIAAAVGAGAPGASLTPFAPRLPYVKPPTPIPMAPAIVSGGAGGGASDVARQAGYGQGGQLAAGVLGSILAPAGLSSLADLMAKSGRFGMGVAQPFLPGGIDKTAGQAMRALANDPDKAMASLGNIEEYVPGSVPTTATASADPGLLAVENTLRSEPEAGQQFRIADAASNRARQNVLQSIAGSPEALQTALNTRSGNAMTNYALAAQSTPEITSAALNQIKPLMDTPFFKSAWQSAETDFANDLHPPSQVDLANPTFMDYVKRAMDDQISAAAPKPGESATNSFRILVNRKNNFVDWLDSLNPAYQTARQQFATDSIPINQMQTAQDLVRRVQNTGISVLSDPLISPAQFIRSMRDPSIMADLQRNLTPDQITQLQNVSKDLERSTMIGSMRVAGSNTVQNFGGANAVANALGPQSAGTPWGSILSQLPRYPYKWTGIEDQLGSRFDQAMRDPALGLQLMSGARKQPNPVSLRDLLLKSAPGYLLGGAMGAPASQGLGAQ